MNFLRRIILKIAANRFVVQDRIVFIYFLLISLELNFQWFGCFAGTWMWVKLLLPILLGLSYFSAVYHWRYSYLLLRVTFWFYALVVAEAMLPTQSQWLAFKGDSPYTAKHFLLCTSLGFLLLCVNLLNRKK